MSDSIDDILFKHRKRNKNNFIDERLKDLDYERKKEKERKLRDITEEQKNTFMLGMKNGLSIREARLAAKIDDLEIALDIFNSYIKEVKYVEWDRVKDK